LENGIQLKSKNKMKTEQLLEIIKSENLTIDKLGNIKVLAKFVQSKAILFDLYDVRKRMFADANYRYNSGDTVIYEGLNEVVEKLCESVSENILFIEVKTDEGDEISLFFQENDNVFLGYIYLRDEG
jgi:hypothetical protein